MDTRQILSDAQRLGRTSATVPIGHLRGLAQAQLRRSLGLTEEPPAPCEDPSRSFLDPSGPTRALHSDLPVMLIGGISSLLLQSLHPGAMAGVAQYSRYAEDPFGRLERTARFIATTTYGSTDEANAAISRVRRIHDTVAGLDDAGVPYAASDPHLLRWVHAAEVASFIAAHRRYGAHRVAEEFYDAYLAEMSRVACALGADWVPASLRSLEAYFASVRPELRVTAGTLEVRHFLLHGASRAPHQVLIHQVLLGAARDVLPSWAAAQLELDHLPATDLLLARPAAHGLSGILRLIVPVPELRAG